MLSQCMPSEEHRNSSWYPCLCERERVLLGYSLVVRPSLQCLNVSQRISQATGSDDDELITLVPTMRLWLAQPPDGQEPRLLTGREALAVQGWPLATLHDKLEWGYTMIDLAGNAISGQVWMALLRASWALCRASFSRSARWSALRPSRTAKKMTCSSSWTTWPTWIDEFLRFLDVLFQRHGRRGLTSSCVS